MSKTPTYDPMTSEARSSWLAGLTEACNKISGVLNMKTSTFEDLNLPELYISDEDRYRIYQAPLGNKLWLANPAPVIKKNGVVITPSRDHFSIDYLGGSIAFEDEYILQEGDIITASATYIVDGSEQVDTLIEQIEAISREAGRNKGAFDSLTSLQTAYPTASAGDIAIVTDEDTIYLWDTDTESWVDVHKNVDLSNYYTSAETDNLLGEKENTISEHGTSESSDNYYYGGRKTWINLFDKMRSFALTGLVTDDTSVIEASDTLLVALGKLQAQISGFKPYISGSSAPTTSTEGEIGQDYINTSNGDKYHLVSVDGGKYNWEKYGDVTTAQLDTAISDLQDDVDGKVSRYGDTMTGALTFVKDEASPTADSSVDGGAGSNLQHSIEISNENIVLTRTNSPDITIHRQNPNQLSINAELIDLKDGTNANSAATIAQLTARIEALEAKLTPTITAAQESANEAKTTADNAYSAVSEAGLENGPFLPLKGGSMTGNINIPYTGLIKDTSQMTRATVGCMTSNMVPTIFGNEIASATGNVYGGFGFSHVDDTKRSVLQGIADPVNDSDAANKSYVDSMAGGIDIQVLQSGTLSSTNLTYTFSKKKLYAVLFDQTSTDQGSCLMIPIFGTSTYYYEHASASNPSIKLLVKVSPYSSNQLQFTLSKASSISQIIFKILSIA